MKKLLILITISLFFCNTQLYSQNQNTSPDSIINLLVGRWDITSTRYVIITKVSGSSDSIVWIEYNNNALGCSSATSEKLLVSYASGIIFCLTYGWNLNSTNFGCALVLRFPITNKLYLDAGCYDCANFVLTRRTCTPVLFTQSATICAGQSFTVCTNTHTSSGTYTEVLNSYEGCDSVVTTHLTVNPLPTVSISGITTICRGNSATLTASGASTYTWSSGSTGTTKTVTPTSTKTYTVTGTDANTCKNTDTITVTVVQIAKIIQSDTICAGQSLIVGTHTYSVSGTYRDTLTTTKNNCDSIIITHLTVSKSIHCITGIDENNMETDISIYPNPTTGEVNIKAPTLKGVMQIKITDMFGQTIYEDSSTLQDGGLSITLPLGLGQGIYFIEVIQNGAITRTKLMKE